MLMKLRNEFEMTHLTKDSNPTNEETDEKINSDSEENSEISPTKSL